MRLTSVSLAALAALTLAATACSSATTSPSDGGTTSPTDGGTTPPTDGSTTPPTDASTPPPALPPPASFNLTTGTCTDTPPCGGSIEGTWDYSAACVPDTAFLDVTAACPTAKLTKLTGTMSGRLTVQGTSLTRKATAALKAEINVPTECASLAGGCSGLTTALRGTAGIKSATCAAGAASSCDCVVEADTVMDKSGTTFTTSGNTLTTSDGDEYSYCVAGSKLTHKQTKAAKPADAELGSYEAAKR